MGERDGEGAACGPVSVAIKSESVIRLGAILAFNFLKDPFQIETT